MRCLKGRPGAVLSVTGDDHQDFLQGQGTADLRGPVGFCRYSLWLDFKGKILGDAHVFRRSESEMLLVSDLTPAKMLMEKFGRHIIADDVEIEDRTDQFTLISLDPDSGLDEDPGFPVTAPEPGYHALADNHILFNGRRLGKGTLQVLAPIDAAADVNTNALSDAESEALRIAAAMPLLPRDSDGQSLNPIEANIISALSFSKGCYLGQEVVARVERLGRVSKRLAQFRGEMGLADQGCLLHLEGQPVGRLTSVVNSEDTCLAIGWLKSKIADGTVVLDEGEFQIQSLPGS